MPSVAIRTPTKLDLDAICTLVKTDLKAVDQFIISQLESTIPLINQIIEYILSCGGKRIRPLILLLAARALHPKDQKYIGLAAVIELIHTATLLHDDVVDSSTLRRGQKTAHTIWGNNASVLVGDFLYSRAFQTVVNLKNHSILDVFAKATHYIAEGEMMQLVNCNNPDTTEAFYFEIIQRKTGKLFEIAAQLGALLVTNSETQVKALREYGLHLGLAYQLIDDALDYSESTEKTGKNVGQDIATGKTTLPLIYAMRQCKTKELKLIQAAIRTGSNKHLPEILDIIETTDAIKYTADVAKKHAEQAKKVLMPVNPSPYRLALEDLSDFVVSRNY